MLIVSTSDIVDFHLLCVPLLLYLSWAATNDLEVCAVKANFSVQKKNIWAGLVVIENLKMSSALLEERHMSVHALQ